LLHHRIEGHGPVLALLHPVGLDLTFLDPVAAALKNRFTVLNIDLRGHGESPKSPPAASLEDYAGDVHALLEGLGLGPAAAVGFSFGGMVAQTLALNYPADVSALAICACPCTLSPQSREIAAQRGADAERGGMAAVLEATLDRWFNQKFRSAGGDAPARARLLADDVSGWAQAWRAIAKIDTLPHLGGIRLPALCLAGELDKSSPPSVVKTIADAIPGARFTVLADAPHMLFIEQPREVARIVGDFLAEVLGVARR
jgi:3-oxoadipate enol-lactonase